MCQSLRPCSLFYHSVFWLFTSLVQDVDQYFEEYFWIYTREFRSYKQILNWHPNLNHNNQGMLVFHVERVQKSICSLNSYFHVGGICIPAA